MHRLRLSCADQVCCWVQGLLQGPRWVVHQAAGIIWAPGVGCCCATCRQHALVHRVRQRLHWDGTRLGGGG